MERIAIIGPSGAGKSTLAKVLGAQTGLPVCHIDALHWKPGWIESAREETKKRVEDVVSREKWIIEGNYSSSLEARLKRAAMVIFLDFPRWRYFSRVIRRTVRYYGTTRPDLGEGCPERFDWEFIRYVWNFPKQSRQGLLDHLARYPGTYTLHVLKSPRQVRKFLSGG